MREIILSSSILILVILAARRILQTKISRRLTYSIWLLAALRLLIPVQFGSFDFNILTPVAPVEDVLAEISQNPVSGPSREDVYKQIVYDYIQEEQTAFTPEVQLQIQNASKDSALSPEEIYGQISHSYAPQDLLTPEAQVRTEALAESSITAPTIGEICAGIWVLGSVVMAVWFLCINIIHSKRLHRDAVALPCEDSPIPVMSSPQADSPCLFGLFRPVIYLPANYNWSDASLRHVLTHELTHYKHLDHIWSTLRCICLCVYWFHPLVWVAAFLSRRDCELACDEDTLENLGSSERLAYGKTLLDVISKAPSPNALLHTATAMNESKKQLLERMRFIVKKPKIRLSAVIAMILVCALTTGCAFAGTSDNAGTTVPSISLEPTETTPATETSTAVPEASQGSMKDNFQSLINAEENLWYVPNYYVENIGVSAMHDLNGNLLLEHSTDESLRLTLISSEDGSMLADYSTPADKDPNWYYAGYIQVIADHVVLFRDNVETIEILNANLEPVAQYFWPGMRDVTLYLGADLKTLYVFESKNNGDEYQIQQVDLESGERTVLLPEIYGFCGSNNGVISFGYFDHRYNADFSACLDLESCNIVTSPAEGYTGWSADSVDNIWLHYSHYDYPIFDLWIDGQHVAELDGTFSNISLLKDQKHILQNEAMGSMDHMDLYNADGTFLSSCEIPVSYSEYDFVWNEDLSGYFVLVDPPLASEGQASRLYFWDISVPREGEPLYQP